MNPDTPGNILAIPVNRIVEDALKDAADKLKDFDAEQRAIVERCIARTATLAGEALFANDAQRVVIEAEAKALKATLLSLAEEKAAVAERVLEDFVARMFGIGSKMLIAALA